MKNDEKIDIKLTGEIAEEDLTPEEYFQLNYDTALRYINIAEHMKQFEDQDKYYHRAIQYLKKINDNKRYDAWMTDLRHLKFGARAEGKVALYEEACHLRDTAKTAQDYYAAQTIFLRIAKYEVNHPLYEKYTKPEVYAKAVKYNDSAAQVDYCEEMARQVDAKARKKSFIASATLVLAIIALLIFSRTTAFRQILATTFNMMGDYTSAYQKYNAVYERSGKKDETAYNNYLEARYKAAMKELKNDDTQTAYTDFKAIAKDDYKDSRKQLFAIEKEQLKAAELSTQVEFASMQWRVLDKVEDNVLLIKDHALGSTPFNDSGAPCTWATSSVRTFLNTTFLEENFYEDELNAINDSEVITPANPYYKGVDGGENTIDKVYLLSITEEEKYVEQLHSTETCWWLRTPGAFEGSMAFVYRDKQVMPYGYDVASTEITVKPVIWVSLK